MIIKILTLPKSRSLIGFSYTESVRYTNTHNGIETREDPAQEIGIGIGLICIYFVF